MLHFVAGLCCRLLLALQLIACSIGLLLYCVFQVAPASLLLESGLVGLFLACQIPDTAAPTCRELASLREVCEAGKREADKLQELLRYEEEKRVEAQGALEGERGAREGDAAAFKQQVGPASSWGCLDTGQAHCSLASVSAGWAVNGLLCKSGLH